MKYEVTKDSAAYSAAMGKQIRGIMRKYEGSEPVCRRYRQLAVMLGYPLWRVEYFPSGVIELTLATSGVYDHIGIYVRADGYEVQLSDGFMRGSAREVKDYLGRKL